jgi:hypothetical protein
MVDLATAILKTKEAMLNTRDARDRRYSASCSKINELTNIDLSRLPKTQLVTCVTHGRIVPPVTPFENRNA